VEEAVYVGIDVRKQWVGLHVVPRAEQRRSGRDEMLLSALAARLATLSPELIVLEPTDPGGGDAAGRLGWHAGGREDPRWQARLMPSCAEASSVAWPCSPARLRLWTSGSTKPSRTARSGAHKRTCRGRC
jgi:hypothetical protein